MSLRFGYVTNGLADHRLDDALELLAEEGYAGVAITLGHAHLDPYAPDLARRVARLGRRLDELDLAVAIETGARFLLDPRRKHAPGLACADAAARLDLTERAISIGAELGAEAVTFASGSAPEGTDEWAWRGRLSARCDALARRARERGVVLAIEPEPGMAVATIADAEGLRAELGSPPGLGLTLDVGHCRCLEPRPVPECVERVAGWLAHVHVEDMRRGVHEHLDFGDGEVDFPAALAALSAAGYAGLVSVELSRHSHVAHEAVPRALAFLREAEPSAGVA
ncbi:MAG: sugar phosphate isomerase/epimerase family protein [Thermoleophilia bacterium]